MNGSRSNTAAGGGVMLYTLSGMTSHQLQQNIVRSAEGEQTRRIINIISVGEHRPVHKSLKHRQLFAGGSAITPLSTSK